MATRFRQRTLAAVAGVAMTLLGGAAQAAGPEVPDGETRGQWFVQVRGSLDTFRARAKASGIEFNERFAYRRVWNGVSVARSRIRAATPMPTFE